jgi:hypothetical protein
VLSINQEELKSMYLIGIKKKISIPYAALLGQKHGEVL